MFSSTDAQFADPTRYLSNYPAEACDNTGRDRITRISALKLFEKCL
jgi:hypothetical protein